jgi:hypothetical protein
VIFALARPAVLLGMLVAFGSAIVLRASLQRVLARRLVTGIRLTGIHPSPTFDRRRDIDVFGVVGAVLGGTGWGRISPLPEYSGARPRNAARRAIVLAAPSLLLLVASQAVLAGIVATGSGVGYSLSPIVIFRTEVGTPSVLFLLALAAGWWCFALLDLIPLPPLDGWGLARLLLRRDGPGYQQAAHWLVGQNLGEAILVIGMLPLFGGVAPILIALDARSWPITVLWS